MFLHDRFLPNTTLDLYTDAAKSKGFGGVYGSRWFYGSFPDDWKVMNIMTISSNHFSFGNLGKFVEKSLYFVFHRQ